MVSQQEIVIQAAIGTGLSRQQSIRYAKFIRDVFTEEFNNIIENPKMIYYGNPYFWLRQFKNNREYLMASQDIDAIRMMTVLFINDGEQSGRMNIMKQFRRANWSREKIKEDILAPIMAQAGVMQQQELEILQQEKSPTRQKIEEKIYSVEGTNLLFVAFKGDASSRKNNWGVYESTETGNKLLYFGLSKENALNQATRIADENAKSLQSKVITKTIATIEAVYPIYIGKPDQKQFIRLSIIPSSEEKGKYIVHYTNNSQVSKRTRNISLNEANRIVYYLRNIYEIEKAIKQNGG